MKSGKKNNPQPVRADIPEFYESKPGKGLEGLELEDFQWIGEEGELSDSHIDALLEQAFTPESALKQILIAIIRSHSDNTKPTEQARVSAAMQALLGPNAPPQSRGPKKLIKDDEILALVARKYLAETFVNAAEQRRKVSRLCREALFQFEPTSKEWDTHRREDKVKALCIKFEEVKDHLLVAGSSADIAAAERQRILVAAIIEDLRELQIVSTDCTE